MEIKMMKYFIIIFTVILYCSCGKQTSDSYKKGITTSSVISKAEKNPFVFPDFHMYGSSYYPEQWDEAAWEDDFRKMAEIGFNVVRMGEFAWVLFEPEEGKYDFTWMDKAIDLAAKYNIKTVLCTPTAAIPPWLYKKHPEVLSANEKGKYTNGGRKGTNVNSIKFIEASLKITEALSMHYKDNPNVIGWQLDNEPGHPFYLYDNVSLLVFRDWLKARYGNIENLNKAWYSPFWSLIYDDFDEIGFALNNEGGWSPQAKVDYRRFFSYAFQNHLSKQAEILRKYIGNRFISTNWPNVYWSIDVFDSAEKILDVTSWDNYSPMPGLVDHRTQYGSAFNDDISRCAGPNQRFFIAERPTQVAAHVLPGAFRSNFYRDLAHGSMGSIFFEWKSPLGGHEFGYKSVLQFDGSFNQSEDDFIQIGKELKQIGPELLEAKTEADIALIYSFQNQWEKGFWSGSAGYDVNAENFYIGLRILNRNVDAIPEFRDLDNYKLVVAPGLRMISDETYHRIENWVKEGGVLVLDCNSGTRDTLNRYREMIPPGVFREMAGIRIENSSSKWSMSGNLLMGSDNQMKGIDFNVKFINGNQTFEPASVIEELILEKATPIAFANGAGLTGKCAISLNKYGKGSVIYVGTDCSDKYFYEEIFKFVQKEFDIQPILDAPYGCEVVSRIKDGKEYIFVLNYTTNEHSIFLPCEMYDMLSEKTIRNNLTLHPLDVKILIRNI